MECRGSLRAAYSCNNTGRTALAAGWRGHVSRRSFHSCPSWRITPGIRAEPLNGAGSSAIAAMCYCCRRAGSCPGPFNHCPRLVPTLKLVVALLGGLSSCCCVPCITRHHASKCPSLPRIHAEALDGAGGAAARLEQVQGAGQGGDQVGAGFGEDVVGLRSMGRLGQKKT